MTTGEAGMVSQAIGLAQAVGLLYEAKTIHPRAPWNWLPGHLAARLGILSSLNPQDGIAPPWPDLLITCGRRSVAVALAIKQASNGRTFTVHIQNPRVPPAYFNMVVPPEHDGLTGPNVYPSKGALHKLTREELVAAAKRFHDTFSSIRKPFVAVLIGGKSKAYNLTPSRMHELAEELKSLIENHDTGMVITTSRRTGQENEAILRHELTDTDAVIWNGTGENPYLAMLALADFIIVTEDSASMISEACFTGKPVYIAKLEGGSKRFDELHRSLQKAGYIREFTGKLETWYYAPLDENQRVATIVHEQLSKHRKSVRLSSESAIRRPR
jgi:mitochondrial fission protein ELM1